MKKNTKYRSNNHNSNNQFYSLNYKFDSVSPAGKCSGTALDLIKRYNELAKEAQGNADYVEAECFRQYAEHYRKIVTEINERKSQRFGQNSREEIKENVDAQVNEKPAAVEVEVKPVVENDVEKQEEKIVSKRSFKVIEVNAADAEKPVSEVVRPRRGRIPKKLKEESVAL